jgi:hypothetical protein
MVKLEIILGIVAASIAILGFMARDCANIRRGRRINREMIRREVQAELNRQLEDFSIDVVDFLINDLEFLAEFTKSIERKQVATQDALAASQKVEQAKAEARQEVERARGQATVGHGQPPRSVELPQTAAVAAGRHKPVTQSKRRLVKGSDPKLRRRAALVAGRRFGV